MGPHYNFLSLHFLSEVRNVAGMLAYIDPGTGSLLFQALAASLLSAGLFIKGVRDRVVWLLTAGWCANRSDDAPTQPEIQSEETTSNRAGESPSRRAA